MFGGNIYGRTNTCFGARAYVPVEEDFYFECKGNGDDFKLECYDEHESGADFLGSTDPMSFKTVISD